MDAGQRGGPPGQIKRRRNRGLACSAPASGGNRECNLRTLTEERRLEIKDQLLRYCHLDTLAMVRMWEVFRGIKMTP